MIKLKKLTGLDIRNDHIQGFNNDETEYIEVKAMIKRLEKISKYSKETSAISLELSEAIEELQGDDESG